MSMTQVRKRLLPFVIGTLSVGLAGVVSAQSNSSDQNAVSTSQAPATGVTVLHRPGGDDSNDDRTNTPIKHVILLIGENRTFDHVYATYTPPKGQSVHNLLSEG